VTLADAHAEVSTSGANLAALDEQHPPKHRPSRFAQLQRCLVEAHPMSGLLCTARLKVRCRRERDEHAPAEDTRSSDTYGDRCANVVPIAFDAYVICWSSIWLASLGSW